MRRVAGACLVLWFEGWNFDRQSKFNLKAAGFAMTALTIAFGVPESRYFLYMGY